MTELVTGLFGVTGLLFVAAALSGVAFDRVDSGPWRNAIIGLLFGVTAALAMLAAIRLPGGVLVDARAPLLILAGLFGGWIGALAALPIPVILRIESGGPWMAGVASVLLCAGLGVATHHLLSRLGRTIDRTALVWMSVASPLVLAPSVAVPGFDLGFVRTVLVPIASFDAVGTLLLGMALRSELCRSDTERTKKRRASFENLTKLLPADVFSSQLLHHWKMFEFFNIPHAYILISIDDAATLQRELGPKPYDALRTDVAKIVSQHVRAADLASARDFDRFAVLVPQGDAQTARAIATRIQDMVRAHVTCPRGSVTVSVGLADVSDGFQAGDVEAAAEGALFQANAHKSADAIGPGSGQTLAANAAEAPFRPPCWYAAQPPVDGPDERPATMDDPQSAPLEHAPADR